MRINQITSTFVLTVLFLYTVPVYSLENSTQLYENAVELAKKGEIDAAIEAFKRTIKASPNYSLGHYGLGKAYLYKDGMLQEAVKHLKLSVELDHSLSKGYFYLGIAYMLSKKYEPAIHAFSDAYRYDNEKVEALYNIAAIYEILQNNYQSQKYYKLYLERMKK
ncbi:MAG: tetratricopeptide repeat protein [Spirochaetes bacterium]|nr:tetratricopeptide repeat protein [Spirochaetota bacterium]